MAACDWREAPDGFTYLDVDFRGGDAQERSAALQAGTAAVRAAVGRVAVLCHREAGAFDVAWFKLVKDTNRALRHLDLKVAFVGLGSRGGVYAGMLNLRVGHERVRAFDDEGSALAWMQEIV